MLFIRDIKPSLNTQTDSIRTKRFTCHLVIYLPILPVETENIPSLLFVLLPYIFSVVIPTFDLLIDNDVKQRRHVVNILRTVF